MRMLESDHWKRAVSSQESSSPSPASTPRPVLVPHASGPPLPDSQAPVRRPVAGYYLTISLAISWAHACALFDHLPLAVLSVLSAERYRRASPCRSPQVQS